VISQSPGPLSRTGRGGHTGDELRETAREIIGAKRRVNVLAGWRPAEDTLPERFLNTPLPDDDAAVLSSERLQQLVAEYHRQRGW